MPATQYAKCTELFKFPAVDLNTEPLPSRHEYVNDTNHFLPYQYFTEFLETALSFSYNFINSGNQAEWPLVSWRTPNCTKTRTSDKETLYQLWHDYT